MSGPGIEAHLRRIIGAEHDQRLGAAAVAGGHLSADVLERALAEAEEQGVSLREVLLARQSMDEQALDALETALAREDFARPVTQVGAALPAEAAAVAREPGRQIAQFVLVSLLGRGGAGEVWRSWDRRLGRWVALKVSTALASTSARERFRREAAAVARLAHPHIVPLYEFGAAEDGRPYLVMPLVEGTTLQEVDLPLSTALALVATVASAVEYAHRQGVVHRDLKPANLMLDPRGHVYVLDFGLVHLHEASAMATRPGDVLGTAAYMSPEQARGLSAAQQPTTDVYGLGATLYHLITGAAPYAGASFAEIVARVLEGKLTPPRQHRPALPPDAEAVVLKAMAAEPGDRYPTARALEEDLRRLAAGKPTLARPVGRLRRWTGRHRLALVATVAGLGLLFAGGALVRQRGAATSRAMEAMARAAVDNALRLRRTGDHAALARLLPDFEAAHGAGAGDDPTIESLRGRLYRAVMREDQALACQERALARAPDHGPALYERAVLLSHRHGRLLYRAVAAAGVMEAPEDANPRVRPPAAEIEAAHPELRALRDRLLADLQGLEAMSATAYGGQARALAARGIVAFHRGDATGARALLKRALDLDPTLEEAWETLAAAADTQLDRAAAERAYTQGLAHDRGYLPHLVGRCRIFVLQRRLDAAMRDAAAALAADPLLDGARLCAADARSMRAQERGLRGQDPSAELAEAERDMDVVLGRSPSAKARYVRGGIRRARASFRARRGQDPLPMFQAAEEDLSEAIASDPRNDLGWSGRGWIRAQRGAYLVRVGRDGSAALDAAWADLTEALRLNDARTSNREWRAQVSIDRAAMRFARGEDPSADLSRAREDLAHAIERGRAHSWALVRRAGLLLLSGRIEAAAGRDPLPAWASAEADATRALERMLDLPDAWCRRGAVRAARALYRVRRGQDARQDAASAEADLTRALSVDAAHVESWLERARLAEGTGDRRNAATFLERGRAIDASARL